jgi:RNA polymerase sigma-70 factor, ECF subfamily
MSLLLDITGFEALFQVNYKSMVLSAFRITRDKDISEDIVQDVFIKLWEGRNSVNINISLQSYLFQRTINQSLSYLKKIKNVSSREELYNAETEVTIASVDHALALKDTNRRIDDAINMLPAACRTIFILSRYEQMSYKEIAQKLDLSVKTVEEQMTRALKHLRRCLLLFTLLLVFNFFLNG